MFVGLLLRTKRLDRFQVDLRHELVRLELLLFTQEHFPDWSLFLASESYGSLAELVNALNVKVIPLEVLIVDFRFRFLSERFKFAVKFSIEIFIHTKVDEVDVLLLDHLHIRCFLAVGINSHSQIFSEVVSEAEILVILKIMQKVLIFWIEVQVHFDCPRQTVAHKAEVNKSGRHAYFF